MLLKQKMQRVKILLRNFFWRNNEKVYTSTINLVERTAFLERRKKPSSKWKPRLVSIYPTETIVCRKCGQQPYGVEKSERCCYAYKSYASPENATME